MRTRPIAFASPAPVRLTSLRTSCTPRIHSQFSAWLARRTPPCATRPKVDKHASPDHQHVTSASARVDATDETPFSWNDKWYPIAWSQHIGDNDIKPFRLFGRALVLFRDLATRQLVALDDTCAHRAAPLSQGRLVTRPAAHGEKQTLLECAYHGWRFSCVGTCADIPNMPVDAPKPHRADVRAYATVEAAGGLVFLWWGDRLVADDATLPLPSELSASDVFFTKPFVRHFPFAFDYFLENLLDPSHVQWTHHGTIGADRRRTERELRLEIVPTERHDEILRFRYGRRSSQPTGTNVLTGGTLVHGLLDIPNSPVHMFFVTPVARHECAVFSITGFPNAPAPLRTLVSRLPAWVAHCTSNVVLDGDAAIIAGQIDRMSAMHPRANADSNPAAAAATTVTTAPWRDMYNVDGSAWDDGVREFRRWFDRVAAQLPYHDGDHQSGARDAHIHLNDREHWHVTHCASCTRALRTLRLLRVTALVAAALVASALASGVGVGVVGTALSGATVINGRRLATLGVMGLSLLLIFLMAAFAAARLVRSLTITETAREKILLSDDAK